MSLTNCQQIFGMVGSWTNSSGFLTAEIKAK